MKTKGIIRDVNTLGTLSTFIKSLFSLYLYLSLSPPLPTLSTLSLPDGSDGETQAQRGQRKAVSRGTPLGIHTVGDVGKGQSEGAGLERTGGGQMVTHRNNA
jgi:hypothetical protein